MTQTDAPRVAPDQTRPPPWRDVRVLRVVFQVVFLVIVAWAVWAMVNTVRTNLRVSGLETGFDYLGQPAGVDIRDSPFRPSQPVRDAIIVGLTNTVRVAIVGIAAATIIGILIGVARLSSNWLVRKAAALYVESLRNIPVLVIIIFMYIAVVLRLPGITDAADLVGLVLFSNRGVYVPWAEAAGPVGLFLALLGVALVAALVVATWRTRRWNETGAPHHRVLWGGLTFVLLAVAAYLALSQPLSFTTPTLDGRLVEGGIAMGPEYAALLFALVLYTASHIAEIVRGSIQAVPKGQTEAANALALNAFQRMRYVILPQAFRIMIPPLGNQYLNLTKNSSLAVAIGYFELTRITNQIIANGNPAPQSILILMACYLVLSLIISFFANVVNRALSLERRS